MTARRAIRGRVPGRTGLAQIVFATLRDEITAGRLTPGTPLSRRQVADRFQCSYTTAVEALMLLAHAGLLEVESAQTARIRRIDLSAVRDLYALIEAIETQSIRQACETATAQEIDELYRLAEEVDARLARRDDPHGDGPHLHWQFHKQIARTGRRPVLVTELERNELLLRFQTTWLVTTMQTPDPPRWHSLLVDAIAGRDEMAADAVMRHHVRRGLEKEILAFQAQMTG